MENVFANINISRFLAKVSNQVAEEVIIIIYIGTSQMVNTIKIKVLNQQNTCLYKHNLNYLAPVLNPSNALSLIIFPNLQGDIPAIPMIKINELPKDLKHYLN